MNVSLLVLGQVPIVSCLSVKAVRAGERMRSYLSVLPISIPNPPSPLRNTLDCAILIIAPSPSIYR